jgi:ATP-binding cassette subfamily B protein
MDRKVTAMTRVMNYYSSILTNREAAAERSLFGFSEKVDEKFREYHKLRTDTNLKTITAWMKRAKLGGVFLVLFGLFMMVILLDPVSSGRLSIGMYISLIGTSMSFVNNFSWQIGRLLQNLARDREYFKDFTKFMNLDEHSGVLETVGKKLNFEYIEFNNVSFKYPGTDRYIFKNLSFHIDQGKHYAFVGTNGAGKTTIVKLMTGLYKVQEGEITINGKNINNYSYQDLISLFAIIYQDFAKYYISLKENITLGNKGDVEAAIEKAGLEGVIQRLPEGIDTPLGKIYENGVDISGGEWQRVAIARVLFNEASFKILDEPTAALSPAAENEVYTKFNEIIGGATTLMISHRLGSTKLADIIFVLDGGRILEKGSHSELMDKKGKYAVMFESQKRWYDE